jgi:RNA polymerase sigma factor (sigma-70 family)
MVKVMTDDMTLLRDYALHDSEEAFAALVSRHVNLVYSVALRDLHDPFLAEEITQVVFIILARRAESLGPKVILSGWLCRTARYASANALTTQRRRQQREQEAYMQSILNEAELDAWTQIAPLLGGAMEQLGQKDHDAVVLRFFEGKSFQEIGTAFGASENAAKKRVAYALEKLRKYFSKRGAILPIAVITAAISANSIQAAPAVLAKTTTAVAITKGVTAPGSTLTLIKGALKIMAWTKAKTGIVIGVAAIFAAGTTTVAVKEINHRPGYYNGKSLKEWLKTLDDQNPGPANDEAANAVRHIGTNGLPVIISLLQISDPMHHNAVLACEELGAGAKPAIPALMKLLNDGYANGYVGAAIDRIGQDGITPLIEALTNENASVRLEVVHALGSVSFYSGNTNIQMSNAISALIDSLEDKSPSVRSIAANSLGGIRGVESTVVPALIKGLDDNYIWTRWNACLALGQFGAQAKSAIPALLAKLNSDARGTAAIALVQIEPDNATRINSLMPILIENIEGIGGTNMNYRSTTADALGSIGEIAKPAVPALLKAAQVTTGYEQQRIVIALKKIDPEAATTVGLK